MATYGNEPGVVITTSTGQITGVTIGRAQYHALVGVGGSSASVDPNTVVFPEDREDVDNKFGQGSDIAEGYRRALDNGANPNFIMAVRGATTVTTSSIGSGGTLANTPVIPDKSRITATDTVNAVELEVIFDYVSDPVADSSGTVRLNPYNGVWDTNESDVEIEYEYADWASAIDAVESELFEGEFCVINPLTASSEVATTLDTKLEAMRTNELKMAVGAIGAEPNASDGEDPWYDTSTYDNALDSDRVFLFAPTMAEDPDTESAAHGVELLSAAGGLMAGNETDEPIYDDVLMGVQADQQLSRSETQDLRDQHTIPVRHTGVTRLADNQSSFLYTDDNGNDISGEEWERDYFRRRIVDLVIATSYQIARAQIGTILDGETIEDVNDSLQNQLDDFVDDGLLEAGQQELDVFRVDDRTIGVDLTVRPYGVAKNAQIDLEIVA